jgi:hypothetical protein
MWRIRSLSLHRGKLANYAMATSVLLVAVIDESLRKPSNDELDKRMNQSNKIRICRDWYCKRRPTPFQLDSQVKCEAFQETLTQQSRAAMLSRRATIRLLDQTSNPVKNMYVQYDIDWRKTLGEGAFGTVYLATNRKTSDQVALKKIPKRVTDDASFQNEVNALVRVRENGGHPHICGLRDIFEDEKYYYMVLDLVCGGEMFEHLIKLGAYSEADASRLVKEVATALTFLHGIGIVHGDLKPENLMLSTDRTEDGAIQIVDFGCAQVSDDNGDMILKSSAGNTPAYCPPEVLESPNGPIAPPMDVWGLGVILYIMLVGLHPFDLKGEYG